MRARVRVRVRSVVLRFALCYVYCVLTQRNDGPWPISAEAAWFPDGLLVDCAPPRFASQVPILQMGYPLLEDALWFARFIF